MLLDNDTLQLDDVCGLQSTFISVFSLDCHNDLGSWAGHSCCYPCLADEEAKVFRGLSSLLKVTA